jgi:hypothetical protein
MMLSAAIIDKAPSHDLLVRIKAAYPTDPFAYRLLHNARPTPTQHTDKSAISCTSLKITLADMCHMTRPSQLTSFMTTIKPLTLEIPEILHDTLKQYFYWPQLYYDILRHTLS